MPETLQLETIFCATQKAIHTRVYAKDKTKPMNFMNYLSWKQCRRWFSDTEDDYITFKSQNTKNNLISIVTRCIGRISQRNSH